jgi:site-specific DNA-methyltransferase (adenine-specific)
VESVCNVFDQVRRTLHPQGVFYLNIGDTYYSGNGQPHGEDPRSPSRNFMRKHLRPVDCSGWSIPKKSLIGVPWKVAFEMQARGWTLRSSIIWNRGNAFVEPTARDRPYRQYENIFLFSKTRFYNYDRAQLGGDEDVWNIPIARQKSVDHSAAFPRELARRCILTGSPPGGFVLDPFIGSGTTIDVALEHGRLAVGIDLSATYVKAVAAGLIERSYSPITWDLLERRLRRTPAAFGSWPGNIRNFRKPGTPKPERSLRIANSVGE